MAVAKVRCDHALQPIAIPGHPPGAGHRRRRGRHPGRLDIADAGYQVVLVEREPSIGGKMAGLSETFPTLDCSQCILTPRMVDVGQHPQHHAAHLFRDRIGRGLRRQFQGHDPQEGPLRGRGEVHRLRAVLERPARRKRPPAQFDYGMGKRTAIYVPFPQAVPARPVIDRDACLHFLKGKCGICAKKCQAGAIRFDDEDQLVTEEVGAIVVATGFQLYSIGKEQSSDRTTGYGEYGYGRYPDVIDSLAVRAVGLRLGAHQRRDSTAVGRASAQDGRVH